MLEQVQNKDMDKVKVAITGPGCVGPGSSAKFPSYAYLHGADSVLPAGCSLFIHRNTWVHGACLKGLAGSC